ncbi:hypothetical protein P344_01395 [Spiroplasma mirum ATCC 29335]|uniref:Uncharacterized protein n=1 Tax=Spiroplasma mirum ATCC 29335 TaxID=838561 RepID=W6AVB9_9MOLU|nr:hypothetical protein P344_01395 [Spiroplasma mirum ATCC 29335]
MLGILKAEGNLEKLSIFSLNSNNWAAIATLTGNFQNNDDGIKGTIQLGTAWWFADTYTGNIMQIEKFAELSTLGINI